MKEVNNKIAQLVRRVRGNLKLGQKEFANKFKRSKSTMSLWEKGKRMPPATILLQLLEMDGKVIFYETDCPTCNGSGTVTSTKL